MSTRGVAPAVNETYRPQDDDLHTVAETFLRQYLAETGSTPELVQLSCVPNTAHDVAESRAVAVQFVKELRTVRRQKRRQEVEANRATRIEIEEPRQVILSRRCGTVITYFYGWKQHRPLLVHAVHLALVLDICGSENLSRHLRETYEIETFPMPSPTPNKGTF
jgi:hypothetical protein